MTLDTNAYKISQGVSEKTIPLIYGKEDVLINQLYNAYKTKPYTVDVTKYYRGAGKTMQIPVENFKWAVNALTEGVATPISALGWTSKEMTFNWYGDAKQFSIEAGAVVASYTLGDFRGKALSAIGENRDLVFISECENTTTDDVYPLKADGSARQTSLTISEAFSPEQTLTVQTKMMEDNLTMKRVLIHPRQRATLLQNPLVINKDYNNANAFTTGSLIDNYGVEYVVHNAIQSSTENELTVYHAIGMVDKPLFYAQKQAPVFELDRRDILNRSWTFHYYEAFGNKIIRDNGLYVMKSVGSVE